MTTFVATLGSDRFDNWGICKEHRLWGLGGGGTVWEANASRVEAGDQIFVWRSGQPRGFIAQCVATGRWRPASSAGVSIPWPEPERFGGVIPIQLVAELQPPAGDDFGEPGRVGAKFGFNNTVLQHSFEEVSQEVAKRIANVFPALAMPSFAVPFVSSLPPVPISPAQPFDVDPDLIDRGLAAHHETVEKLAKWVEAHGLKPLLPTTGAPQFDLAWIDSEVLHVAEVKSLTDSNEESQLRLGLGQVLRYEYLLAKEGYEVEASLVS
jgi:hypothetical protein